MIDNKNDKLGAPNLEKQRSIFSVQIEKEIDGVNMGVLENGNNNGHLILPIMHSDVHKTSQYYNH